MKMRSSPENLIIAHVSSYRLKTTILIISIFFFLFTLLLLNAETIFDEIKFTVLTSGSKQISHEPKNLKPENSLVYEIINRGWSVNCISYENATYCPFFKKNYQGDEVLGHLTVNYKDPVLPKRTFTDFNIFVRESEGSNNIFSLEFTKGFKWEIIQNIKMQSSRSDVAKAFGQPHFEDNDNNVIGYMFKEFYIFFSGTDTFDEVSVYRRYTSNSIRTLASIFQSLHNVTPAENIFDKIKKSLNDYDRMITEDGYIRIDYISSGFYIEEIQENPNIAPQVIFTLYGNYAGDLKKDLLLMHEIPGLKVILKLDKDLVFEKEIQRLGVTLKRPIIVSPDFSKKVYYYNGKYDTGIRLYYLDKSRPDISYFTNELTSDIFWLNDRYFTYTCHNSFITFYDTKTDKIFQLSVPSEANVSITNAAKGVLTYKIEGKDTTEQAILYSFDEKGELYFSLSDSKKMDYYLHYSSIQKTNEYTDGSYNNARGLICDYHTSAATLEGIEYLSDYESLTIMNATFSDSNVLKRLNNMHSLKKLVFSSCKFENPDEAIRVLGSLSNIESLHLDSEIKFHDLLSLTNIKELSIYNCSIEDTSSLIKLTNLKSLSLLYNKNKPIPFNLLESLDSLNIQMSSPFDSIDFLHGMSKLQKLGISGHNFAIGNKDAETLASLRDLQYLTLDSGVIDMTPLSRLENLVEFNATFISSKDYRPLLKLKKLRKLTIQAYLDNKMPGLLELKKKGIVIEVEIGC
jgi:hypothetical protein